MKVKDVMTRKPISLKRSHKLKHALHAMAKHGISGCPVTDSRNNVIGIITKTDIINILDVHGKVHKSRDMFGFVLSAIRTSEFDKLRPSLRDVLEKEIHHFMSSNPVTIDAEADLYEAAKAITRQKVDKLIVVKNGKLVGMLSKTDLIKVLDTMEG